LQFYLNFGGLMVRPSCGLTGRKWGRFGKTS
jgi:hypothetical protein